MEDKCSLLINSCDAYKDILDTFFELLHRFWPNLALPIYLSTESLEYKNKYFDIKNIHPSNKNCAWTIRISESLNQIKSKYVLFMLDDFFLYDNVDIKAFNRCIEWMEKNSKIASFIYYPIYAKSEECNYTGFKKVNKNSAYVIVPAILGLWRKEKLLKYTKDYNEDIWLWEKNATERYKTKFFRDEIYITKDLNHNIFPYDFAKFGLFSGKWQKDTKDLFDKLKLNIDFNKRGYYDEKYRGLSKSIINSFLLDSALIPNYNLKHKGSSYLKYSKSINKNFAQTYNITGAKDMVRWEPSTQWGYAIENLKIEIIFKNKASKLIDTNILFGSFIRNNNLLIFNNGSPYVYIPFNDNELAKEIKISGKIKFPISKEQLDLAYLKETNTNNIEFNEMANKIYHEFLVSEEKVYYIHANPRIVVQNYDENEQEIKGIETYKNNKFMHQFIINSNLNKMIYSYSDHNGYALKNLKIKLILKDGTEIYIPKEKIKGILPFHNLCLFIDHTKIEVDINEYVKEIIITGQFICPVKSKVLKNYV